MSTILEALKISLLATAPKSHRLPLLETIQLKPGVMYTTDRFRLVRAVFDDSTSGLPYDGVLLKADDAKLIVKDKTRITGFTYDDTTALISVHRENGTVATYQAFQGDYPNVERLIWDLPDNDHTVPVDFYLFNPSYLGDVGKIATIMRTPGQPVRVTPNPGITKTPASSASVRFDFGELVTYLLIPMRHTS